MKTKYNWILKASNLYHLTLFCLKFPLFNISRGSKRVVREGSSAKDPFNFDTDPDPRSALEKKDPNPNPDPDISLRFTECFFFAYFYPKTWWTIQKWWNFYNLSFFKNLDLGFRCKKVFFLQFLVDILPLGSGSRKPKSCRSNGSRS